MAAGDQDPERRDGEAGHAHEEGRLGVGLRHLIPSPPLASSGTSARVPIWAFCSART